MRIEWTKREAGFVAELGNITLFAMPDQTMQFGTKPKRGTTWRAGATHWDEATRTASRYGRDCYGEACKTKEDAMRLAERVYNEARRVG